MPYPKYTRAERVADGVVHALGVLGALTGVTLLLWAYFSTQSSLSLPALLLYCTTLLLMLSMSGVYHMTTRNRLKPLLRRMDHAAIFLKIAGTFTPLTVILGTTVGYAILALIWMLALGGAIAKLFFWTPPGRGSTLLYLTMGWMGIAILWPVTQTVPPLASALLITGGLTYSLGVVFFHWENLHFSMAIWHSFVLLATACIFAAIALATLSA